MDSEGADGGSSHCLSCNLSPCYVFHATGQGQEFSGASDPLVPSGGGDRGEGSSGKHPSPRVCIVVGTRVPGVTEYVHGGPFPGLVGLTSDSGEGLGHFRSPMFLLSALPDQTGHWGRLRVALRL